MEKTIWLHQWILHVYTIACLSSAIFGAKVQFQNIYYVTPVNVPCSYSPCFDLGTYMNNPSQYFVSDTQFIFLQGQHILPYSLDISNVNNIELVGYGSMTTHSIAENVLSYGFEPYEQDSTITYTSSSSVIRCNPGQIRIYFSQAVSVSLVNLTIVDCGFFTTVFNGGYAVLFQWASFITIDGISVQNAQHYGILAWLEGPINISRSSFIGNNQYVKNILQKRTSPCSTVVQNCTIVEYWNDGTVSPEYYDGGGVRISFYPTTNNKKTSISSSLFSLSLDARYGVNITDFQISGTGLTLIMCFYGGTEEVILSNNTFYRNQAGLGAGLQLNYFSPGSSSITMENNLFMSGVALQGAGVSYTQALMNNDYSTNITISSTVFHNNYARNYGSSVWVNEAVNSVTTVRTLELNNCTFLNEYGYSSINITTIQSSMTINVNFTIWKKMYETQLVTFSSGNSNTSLLSISMQNSEIMDASAMLSIGNGSLYMYNCSVNTSRVQYSLNVSSEVLLAGYSSSIYISSCIFSGNSVLVGIMHIMSSELKLVNTSFENSLHISSHLISISFFGKVLFLNGSSLLLASSILQAKNGSFLVLDASTLMAENGSSLQLNSSILQAENGSSLQLNSSILQAENGSFLQLDLSTLQAGNGSSLQLDSSTLETENGSSFQLNSSILQIENCSSLQLDSSILQAENGSSLQLNSSILQAENGSFLQLDSSTLQAGNGSSLQLDSSTLETENGSSFQLNSSILQIENCSSLQLDSSILQAENGSLLQLNSSILQAENGSFFQLDSSTLQAENGSFLQLDSSILQAENGSSFQLNSSILQAENGSSLQLNSSILQAEIGSSLLFYSSTLQAENGSSLQLNSSILQAENNTFLKFNSSSLQAENGTHLKLNSSTLQADNTRIQLSGAFVTAISLIDSNANFILTEITCKNYSAPKGGALYLDSSSVVFTNASATFTNNQADLGGGLYLVSSTVSFISTNLNCSSNIARYFGGCLYLLSSNVSFQNTTDSILFNNTAFNAGGGMFLVYQSTLNLTAPSHITFHNNSASLSGGAIFAYDQIVNPNVLPQPQCFFNLTYSNEFTLDDSSISFYFYDNNAPAGSVLYGGNIDTCTPVTTKSDVNDVFVVKSTLTNESSIFSSTPMYLCNCSSSDSFNSCIPITSINTTLYPGQILSVPFVAVGQRNGTAQSVIIPVVGPVDSRFIVLSPILTDAGKGVCRNYTIPYYRSGEPVTVMTQAAYNIGELPVSNFTVNITLLSCPTGFIVNETSDLFTANASCQCDPRLNHVVSACTIANVTIQKSLPSFWIGSMPNNSLVYSNCLPEFCNASLAFNPTQQDEQCLNEHVGVACSSCPHNYSMTLGVPMCRKCSNYYLLLVIVFFAMGLFCVFLLFALNLTVSVGTINGILWYAFVVNLNRLIFAKGNNFVTNVLFVFISWIDFDFGIVSCFYDGMDMYWYTWLQLVFPTFIFLIIGVIVLGAKCSRAMSKLCKPNAVPVLATLCYMSLSKLTRTCVAILYPNQLVFANGTQWVWLYDANIPYLDRWHAVLAGISALILVLIIIPYTGLLVLSPWLQRYSQKRCISWINRLKPFLDNYQAPYKDRFRYWVGALFAFRIIFCVVTVSCINTSNSKVVLVTIIIAHVSIILGAGIAVYKNWVLSVLESFFHINLSVMAALILLYEDDEKNATIVVWIGVGSYLVSVVGIIMYHIACIIASRCSKRNITKVNNTGAAEEEREELLYDQE